MVILNFDDSWILRHLSFDCFYRKSRGCREESTRWAEFSRKLDLRLVRRTFQKQDWRHHQPVQQPPQQQHLQHHQPLQRPQDHVKKAGDTLERVVIWYLMSKLSCTWSVGQTVFMLQPQMLPTMKSLHSIELIIVIGYTGKNRVYTETQS